MRAHFSPCSWANHPLIEYKLTAANNRLPLVVVIDELDRCRPSYAVELLETAKHLFTVDHVVFVLGLNRSELAHSVRAVYGGGFDAEGYLRRFFDIHFRLPDAKRQPFVEAILAATRIDDYFGKRSEGVDYEMVRDWLAGFFDAFDVSLRSIAQAIHHLGFVFATLRDDRRSLTVAATLALILRTIDPKLYLRFTRGEVEDREVIEFLLRRERVPERIGDIKHYLEAVVIVAAMEVRNPDWYNRPERPSTAHLREYRETVKKAGNNDDSEMVRYSRDVVTVVTTVDGFMADRFRGRGLGFTEAVRRLELVSPSLIDSGAS